jgi:hypothetical protein
MGQVTGTRLPLYPLGCLHRHVQDYRQVVGHLCASGPDAGAEIRRPFGEHEHIGSASAQVDEQATELALVLGQHRAGSGQALEDQAVGLEASAVHAAYQVLRRRYRPGDDMDLGFEPYADHVERVADAFLVVHYEGLRYHVQHFAVHGYHDGPGSLDDALDVGLAYLAPLAGDGHDASGVDALDIGAGNADEAVLDLAAGHQLRGFDGLGHRLERRFDIDDDAFAQPGARSHAYAGNLEESIVIVFADYSACLGRADIKPDYQIVTQKRPPLYGIRTCRSSGPARG